MMDPQARTIYGVTGELFNGLMVLGIVVIGWRTRGRGEVKPVGAKPSDAKPSDAEPSDAEPVETPANA
jgi:hypothetical protein